MKKKYSHILYSGWGKGLKCFFGLHYWKYSPSQYQRSCKMCGRIETQV